MIHLAYAFLGSQLVLGKLHGDEHHGGISIFGEALHIFLERHHPALGVCPAADRDAHQLFRPIHLVSFEDVFPVLQGNRLQREYRIRGGIDGAMDAESLQKALRLLVSHRDGIHIIQHMLQDDTNHPVPHRADALGVQENPLPEKHGHYNDSEIVNHALPAGHVLQEAAAAADQKVTFENGLQDGQHAKPRHRLYTKGLGSSSGISGNHGDFRAVKGLSERLEYGQKHGLVSGIMEAIVSGNYNLILCHIAHQRTW